MASYLFEIPRCTTIDYFSGRSDLILVITAVFGVGLAGKTTSSVWIFFIHLSTIYFCFHFSG